MSVGRLWARASPIIRTTPPLTPTSKRLKYVRTVNARAHSPYPSIEKPRARIDVVARPASNDMNRDEELARTLRRKRRYVDSEDQWRSVVMSRARVLLKHRQRPKIEKP